MQLKTSGDFQLSQSARVCKMFDIYKIEISIFTSKGLNNTKNHIWCINIECVLPLLKKIFVVKTLSLQSKVSIYSFK